jgi:hypothetical protein
MIVPYLDYILLFLASICTFAAFVARKDPQAKIPSIFLVGAFAYTILSLL